jgi:phosphoketolase
MVVRNDLDRFHLVADVIDRVLKLGLIPAYNKQRYCPYRGTVVHILRI